jgi:hypothetical protein
MSINNHEQMLSAAGLSVQCQTHCPVVAEAVVTDLDMVLDDVLEARQTGSLDLEDLSGLDGVVELAQDTALARSCWLADRCPGGGPLKQAGRFVCLATVDGEMPDDFAPTESGEGEAPSAPPQPRYGRRRIEDADTGGLV